MSEKHVVVTNFKSGVKNAWKHHKVGEEYDGPEAQTKEFLEAGFLKKASEVAAQKYKSVEEEIKTLEARIAELKKQKAPAAPAPKESESGDSEGPKGKKGK